MANIIRTALRVTLFFMSGCLILWAVVPAWRTVAAGLLLGALVSYINTLLLRRRVEILGERAAEIATQRSGRKMGPGLGLASRIAMVLLAVMAAIRYPHIFNLPAALSACFLVQLAMPLAALYHLKRQDRSKG
jgi:ATP synthase protein I